MGKQSDKRAILSAILLRCRGFTLEEIAVELGRRHGLRRAESTVSRWLAEFQPPFLEIAGSLPIPRGPLIQSWLFTHRKLNYLYQLHRAKVVFAKPFNRLINYLTTLPRTLDHGVFERSIHCSGARFIQNPGLIHYRNSLLSQATLMGVKLSVSNRARHQTVEDILLHTDRNTIATEVPVYYEDRHLGPVAGHIDVLQINYGCVHILDYKPGAAKENPSTVASQLTLYAIALAVRAGLHLHQIRCGYFDEQDLFLFTPRKPTRVEVELLAARI